MRSVQISFSFLISPGPSSQNNTAYCASHQPTYSNLDNLSMPYSEANLIQIIHSHAQRLVSQVTQEIAKLTILVNMTDTIIYLHKSTNRLNVTNLSHVKTSHYVITSITVKFCACIVQAHYTEARFYLSYRAKSYFNLIRSFDLFHFSRHYV